MWPYRGFSLRGLSLTGFVPLIRVCYMLSNCCPLIGHIAYTEYRFVAFTFFSLKRQCHKIFEPRFLHNSNPSGPLFLFWSIFAYGFDFVEIFAYAYKICGVRLRSVNDTAESSLSVSLTPWSQNPRYHSFYGTVFQHGLW